MSYIEQLGSAKLETDLYEDILTLNHVPTTKPKIVNRDRLFFASFVF